MFWSSGRALAGPPHSWGARAGLPLPSSSQEPPSIQAEPLPGEGEIPFHSRPSPPWLSATNMSRRSSQIALFLNFLGLGSNQSSQELLPEKRNRHCLEIHCMSAATRPVIGTILLNLHNSPTRTDFQPDLSLRPREAERPWRCSAGKAQGSDPNSGPSPGRPAEQKDLGFSEHFGDTSSCPHPGFQASPNLRNLTQEGTCEYPKVTHPLCIAEISWSHWAKQVPVKAEEVVQTERDRGPREMGF